MFTERALKRARFSLKVVSEGVTSIFENRRHKEKKEEDGVEN